MASPHCASSYDLQDLFLEQIFYHTDHIQMAYPHCVFYCDIQDEIFE